MPSAIIEGARKEGRTLLTEIEAKQVLEEAGVPVSPARLAKTKDDAAKMADELGYPIVLKIVSPQITHKSDVGGVALNLVRRGGRRRRSTASSLRRSSTCRTRRSMASRCSGWRSRASR